MVVGAGAVGITLALDLARRGAKVTVLERGPVVGAGCSAGNAGVVGASQVTPLASMQALREGLASLPQRHAAFSLKARPRVVPWLARFAAAATPARHAAATAVLQRLAARSAALHAAMGRDLDVGYVRGGFLSVYEREASLSAASAQAARSPSAADVLDASTLRTEVPELAHGPIGGVRFLDDAHVDPPRFVSAVATEVERLGGSVRTGVEVLGVRRTGGRVTALVTTEGDVACGQLVIAAGAWTPWLSRGLGVRIPVLGGKGYFVEYDAPLALRQPVYFPERRMVVTPLADRVRLTGMFELCGTDLRVDNARVDAMRHQAALLVPRLADLRTTGVWRGLRPCTPDGLPIVGRVPRLSNAWLTTGHGMWGLQLALVTAELLGGALAGRPEHEALAPLALSRF